MDGAERIAESETLGSLSESLTESRLGSRLGDFTLLRRLGRGAQGDVYEARQESLARLVALKVLPPYFTLNPDRVQRFRREAEAGGRLAHPNTVGVHSVGESDGCHYIVQELVAGGRTLADHIATARAASELPRDWYERTAALLVQVSEAVHAAHEAGIIHRDIKPGNILITADGKPKVADFGLAMIDDDLHRSRSGELIGTPFYMSPEQAAGTHAGLDRRTDIFSLGTTLYEALTLQRPFDAETREKVVEQIQLHDPVDPRKLRGTVPAELAVICMKALEKRRDRRYQSAGEFASDLNRYLRHEPILARPPGPILRAGKWLRRHPVRTGFAAAFVTMAVMLVALVQSGREARRQGTLASTRAENFHQLMDFLMRDLIDPLLLEVNAPKPRPAPNEPILGRLAEAEARAASLTSHPEEQWYALVMAGCGYRNISMFEEGERNLARALDVARRFAVDDPEAPFQDEHTAEYLVATSAYELGRLRHWAGDLPEAEALLREARDAAVRRDGVGSELAFTSTAELALVLADQGRAQDAEDWMRVMIATDWVSEKSFALQARQLLGRQLLVEGRLDEAAEWLLPLLEPARGVYPEEHWLRLAALVAQLHDERGRAARGTGDAATANAEDQASEALVLETRARLEQLRPKASEQLAYLLSCYGSFLIHRGRLVEARSVLEEGLQVARLAVGEDAPATLELRTRLGVALYQSGRSADAEAQWRAVLDSDCRAPLPQPEAALNALKNLASLCSRAGRFEEARALAQERVARTPDGTAAHEDATQHLDKIESLIAGSPGNP